MFFDKILPIAYNVRLANTSASGASGALVHCSNISFDDNKINNSFAPTTGLIKLANAQTTGPLYLGCGSTTAARTTGPIFIGSDSTASGGINIGTGTDLTVPTVNTINIGKSGTTTTNGGPLTSTGLITATSGMALGNGYGITCPTTSPTLGITNLNYSYNFASTSATTLSTAATTYLYSPSSNTTGAGNYLNAGIYAVFVNSTAYELLGPSTGTVTYTLGVCYGSATGTLATAGPQYGTITSVSKSTVYQRLGVNNLRIGTALAGTFTLPSTNFVNIQIIVYITTTFVGGNFNATVDGLIIRIG